MGGKRSIIEKTAESLGLIKKLDRFKGKDLSGLENALPKLDELESFHAIPIQRKREAQF